MRKGNILPTGLILFGILLGGATTTRALYYAPQEEMPVSPGVSFVDGNSVPKHLSIPQINLEAEIEPVGITKKGNMSTPKKIYDTGWYKYGPKPGSAGSAVIDGHVDNGFGTAGVFANLKNLRAGDDIYVLNEQDERQHFKIYKIESYNYKNVPLDEIFNRKDGNYLNLITCDGDWIPDEQTSERRIVVYSKIVRD